MIALALSAMEGTPTNSDIRGLGGDGLALTSTRVSADLLLRQWKALHDAAAVVGEIVGSSIDGLEHPSSIRDFPTRIFAAGGWRRDAADQGIQDLTAIMQPGLSALLAAHARGIDAVAAARALLGEFTAARDALLALAPLPVD